MTKSIALETLLSNSRPANAVIAWRKDTPLSFNDFSALAARWYGAFIASEHTNIALYCDDSFDFSAALFGAWHAGKCVYLPGDKLPATLARLTAMTDGFAGDLPGAVQALPHTDSTSVVWQPLSTQREQLVIYTSGSTGEPLAIFKRLDQLFSEVHNLAASFDTTHHTGTLHTTVSHQHIYGLLFHILWPLASGRPFASNALRFPEDIVRALSQGPASLVTSPAHLKRLPAGLPWASCRHHLQAIFSSGGPLSDSALSDSLLLLGQAPIEVFGSSETGGMAWRQRTQSEAIYWQPLAGVNLRVTDELLQVSSPHNADMSWHGTGTVAKQTSLGLMLHGRSDRIVKVEEKRISLTAIERVLSATEWISEAHVVVLDAPRLTLGVVALLSAAGWLLHEREGKRGLNTALRHVLAEHIEAVALPRRWRYLHSLPLNAQGKLTAVALKNCFDARRAPARLQSLSSNQATLLLDIAADSPHFEGHFPSLPVLPGVTQIDWAIQLGRELFALPTVFLRLEQIKFQQVIEPSSTITLELNYDAERTSMSFRFSSDKGNHASGRAVFGDGS